MLSLSWSPFNTASVNLSTPPVFEYLSHDRCMREPPADDRFAGRFTECLRDVGLDQLNQTQLGQQLGVSQGMAGRYLRGTDKPKGRKLEEIAVLFDVCQEWLLTGRGPKRPGRAEDDVLDMSGLSTEAKAALRRYAIRLRNTKPATTDKASPARVILFHKK